MLFTKKMLAAAIASVCLVMPALGNVSKAAQREPSSWVPFPWAQELPFTWSTAQGVWVVESGSESSLFYIRVTKDRLNKEVKYLAITERERSTCAIASTGFGTEETGSRIVAEMKLADKSRFRYKMMLRLYDPAGVPKGQHVQPFKGKVLVMTVMPQGSNKVYNYPMMKLSDRTEFPCTPTK